MDKRSSERTWLLEVQHPLLKDDNYLKQIRNSYPEIWAKYEYIQDKRTFWELLKMELRSVTISYAKGKAKETTKPEHAIKDELQKLDHNYNLQFW